MDTASMRLPRKPLSNHVLVSQYDVGKNILPATHVGLGFKSKVWWVCEVQHSWEATVDSRVNSGRGCPVCAGQIVDTGVNDLATVNPELAKQYHSRFNTIPVTQIFASSNRKVWWLGDCGHEWEATVNNRASGTGCPVCVGQKTVPGVNDIKTISPQTAVEWHPTKNIIHIENVTVGSNRKVWWLGNCGHEWEDTVNHRTNGRGCPVCAGKKVIPGVNDIVTTHPDKTKTWGKRNIILPQEVTAGSHKIVYWECEKGHEWETSVANRILNNISGTECPTCAASTYVSKAEKNIADFVASLGFDIRASVRDVIKGELDIFVPEKNIAIEFNGLYWHSEAGGKTKQYHRNKWQQCKDKGVQLIQVWEDEWNRNPELIKRMIAHKLGVSTSSKVFARNTRVRVISNASAKVFLESNHLQGYRAAKYFGLVDSEEELVAVLGVQKKGENGLEIIRFATNKSIPGGFSKLLKFVLSETVYAHVEKVFSYSHNDHSDGGVYEANGFVLEHDGSPGYSYWSNGWAERQNRLKYSPSRVKTNPNLEYVEGATERELAELNSLTRIWDSGSSLWVLEV